MNAIVLDGHLKSALAATRSLGEAGIRVSCGATRRTAMALHSRSCAEPFIYPSPIEDRDAFVASIIEWSRRAGGRPVILSMSDETFLLLSERRDEIAPYATLLLSSPESIAIAFDKSRMHGLGDMLNVPTIPTVVLESKEDAEREASGKRNYPVVLKSRHSCVWKDGHGVKGCARFVFTKEELTREAESIARATGEWPLLQEFVPGDEYGIEYLFHKGAPLRMCAHRRIRSLSPSGGAAVVKETLAAEDPLAEIMDKHSQAILLALDWEGVAMVEWKHDERNGTLRLMELNGRFWGSLPLASYAGANFPAAFARLAMGEDIPRALLWREGVRSRHTLGDVRHLLSVLFARDPMRGIRYPSRLRAVWDFFSGLFSAKDDVWRMSDLGPGLWELVDILKTRIMRI